MLPSVSRYPTRGPPLIVALSLCRVPVNVPVNRGFRESARLATFGRHRHPLWTDRRERRWRAWWLRFAESQADVPINITI